MNAAPRTLAEAVELWLELRNRGEPDTAAEFAARHPRFAPELGAALATLLALDDAAELLADAGTAAPARVGPYRVLREVGRGAMGVVLEAAEEPLGRRVALKLLTPELVASASARARFRREAELAARLDHPGIATVYGAGVDADRPWIAMRFVEGDTLARAIALARAKGSPGLTLGTASRTARESALDVARCIAQVARALEAAHAQGVLHRDVKPSNVVVTPHGAPVLLDFGLAIPEEADGRALTRTGETAGTPAYLAPESVAGEVARPDAQGDVYALGVTLYECLALRRPFDAATPAALYRAILAGSPADLRRINPGVSRDLAVVVATAMDRERARRYRNAAAFAADLEACVAGRPVLARPVSLAGRVARWARREKRQAVLASLVVVAALAAALSAGTWWASRDEVRAANAVAEDRRFEDLLQAGYLKLGTRRAEDADASFARALALRPDSVEARAGRIVVRIETNRADEALALVAQMETTPALAALGAVAERRSPPLDLGAAWLAEASSIEAFVDGLRLRKQAELAPRHTRRELHALATARFTEAIHRAPSARSAYQVQRAFSARDAGDEDAVRSAATALVRLWPDSAKAVFVAGNVLHRFDADAAVPLLERATALDPVWGAPHQILGNVHFFAERLDDAARELHAALRLDPRDADAWNTLGLVEGRRGCVDESRAAYRAAIALRPRFFESWCNMATADAGRRDDEAAEPALRLALELAPREGIPRHWLAHVLDRRGAYDEALHQAETGVGFAPGEPLCWAALCRVLVRLGRGAEALEAAEAGLELAPENRYLRELRENALYEIRAASTR